MIVPDVNLLLYAEIDAFPQHERARVWWEAALNGSRPVGLATASVFGFLRIGTSRRIFYEPLATSEAVARVRSWMTRPQVQLLVPGSRYMDIALGLLEDIGAAGNLTTDVQIAAHAMEVNGEVHSNDNDFGRFEGLRRMNPLISLA